jgi:hypothetical protein
VTHHLLLLSFLLLQRWIPALPKRPTSCNIRRAPRLPRKLRALLPDPLQDDQGPQCVSYNLLQLIPSFRLNIAMQGCWGTAWHGVDMLNM